MIIAPRVRRSIKTAIRARRKFVQKTRSVVGSIRRARVPMGIARRELRLRRDAMHASIKSAPMIRPAARVPSAHARTISVRRAQHWSTVVIRPSRPCARKIRNVAASIRKARVRTIIVQRRARRWCPVVIRASLKSARQSRNVVTRRLARRPAPTIIA